MLPPQVAVTYPFFRLLSAQSRATLAAGSELSAHRRGAHLIRKGDEVGGMYFILSGALRVYTLSPGGTEASLYRVQAGESCLLAVNALFAAVRYPAWVVVESREARLFTVPAAVYRALHEQEPEVRRFTLAVLSQRVFDLMSALEEISLHPLEDRLKSFLLRRADARGEIHATHDEIAAYLATAREVVSRRLKALAAAGTIRSRRGTITVLKPEALATPA